MAPTRLNAYDTNVGLVICRCQEGASSLWSLHVAFDATRCYAGDGSSRSVSVLIFWRRRRDEPGGSIALSIISVSRQAVSFARRLMLPVSNDTLLRVVRRRVHIPTEPLSVIGIDDWAWPGSDLPDQHRR
jgi:hypothetical protein